MCELSYSDIFRETASLLRLSGHTIFGLQNVGKNLREIDFCSISELVIIQAALNKGLLPTQN